MLQWLSDFFSGFFNFEIPEPIKSFDPQLGEIEYRIDDSDDWVIKRSIGRYEIDIHLEGPETQVDSRSKDYFLKIESDLPRLWNDVVDLTIDYTTKYGFFPETENFQLESVTITPISEFENGQLCFWFTIDGDSDGTYFVPLNKEQPIYVHRDS